MHKTNNIRATWCLSTAYWKCSDLWRVLSSGIQRRVARWKSTDTSLLATFSILVSCLSYSSTQKLGATSFSETSVDLQQTTRHYISEDITLPNHRCQTLRSCNRISEWWIEPYWSKTTGQMRPEPVNKWPSFLSDMMSEMLRNRTEQQRILHNLCYTIMGSKC
jgi:hypothetical protein